MMAVCDMNKVFKLFFLIFLFQTAHAQKDTVVTYFKNSGKVVYAKDSADFIRMVLPPDSNVDKNLYRMYDFYPNGKHKAVATSVTGPKELTFDGTYISYFPNGSRKLVVQYNNGMIISNVTNYYPNGKIYNIFKVNYEYDINHYYYFSVRQPTSLLELVECRDSTGVIVASKGNGHFLDYDENFTTLIREGNVVDGKKDGEWRGLVADSGRFVCTFHKNILKSGVSYIRSGNSYPFKQFETEPLFINGNKSFGEFINKNMVYPEFAKQHHITGDVWISFTIKADGSVADIKLVRRNAPCLNEEALRIINLSPRWSPALLYGFPVAVNKTAIIQFPALN
jgi:TonB family protein